MYKNKLEQSERELYTKKFRNYPDVLTTEEFCKMLGGIALGTAWKWIKNKKLRCIHYLNNTYLIPKVWAIDFVLSEYYAEVKHTLKCHV